MEGLIWSFRTEIFSGKRDFLKGSPKFPTEFPNGKCAFHLLARFSSGPFGLDRLRSYLWGRSLGNGTSRIPLKIPFGI